MGRFLFFGKKKHKHRPQPKPGFAQPPKPAAAKLAAPAPAAASGKSATTATTAAPAKTPTTDAKAPATTTPPAATTTGGLTPAGSGTDGKAPATTTADAGKGATAPAAGTTATTGKTDAAPATTATTGKTDAAPTATTGKSDAAPATAAGAGKTDAAPAGTTSSSGGTGKSDAGTSTAPAASSGTGKADGGAAATTSPGKADTAAPADASSSGKGGAGGGDPAASGGGAAPATGKDGAATTAAGGSKDPGAGATSPAQASGAGATDQGAAQSSGAGKDGAATTTDAGGAKDGGAATGKDGAAAGNQGAAQSSGTAADGKGATGDQGAGQAAGGGKDAAAGDQGANQAADGKGGAAAGGGAADGKGGAAADGKAGAGGAGADGAKGGAGDPAGNQGAGQAAGNQGAGQAAGNQGAGQAAGNQGAGQAAGNQGAGQAAGDGKGGAGGQGAGQAAGGQGAGQAGGGAPAPAKPVDIKAMAKEAVKNAGEAAAKAAQKVAEDAIAKGKMPDPKEMAKAAFGAMKDSLQKTAAEALKQAPAIAGQLAKALPPQAQAIFNKIAPEALKAIPGIKGLQKPTLPPQIAKKPKPPIAKAPDAPPGAKPPAAKAPAGQDAAQGGGGKGEMGGKQNTPKYKIKAGKAPKDLPASVTSRMVEIIVDQAIDMADMFRMVIRNDDFAVGDHEDFKPGSKVEIELGYEEGGAKLTKVMAGEVTALQADFPRRGPMMVRIQGYTEYHRFMKGRHIRSFENKTYGDIAKAIASECGLKSKVDSTSGTHEYVYQRNQTNLEFLLEIAELIGFEVYCADGTLNFVKPTNDKTKVRTLKKGEQLLSFNPRSSIAQMPTSVKVISWDEKSVSQVTDSAQKTDAGAKMGGSTRGPDVSEQLTEAPKVVTERVFRKPNQALALAVSLMRRASLDFVTADATVQGAAELRPGNVVQIDGVGPVFSGAYYVVRVVHDFLPGGFATKLGLRKTSIIVPPPGTPEDDGSSQDNNGDIDTGDDDGDELDADGNPKKPKLKNVKLSVGDKPPQWWLDKDTALSDPDALKNLVLEYGPEPPPKPPKPIDPEPVQPPIFETTLEKEKIDIGELIAIEVALVFLDKATVTVEPADVVSINKNEMTASGAILVTGKKDGKATIVIKATGQGQTLEKKHDVLVQGKIVRFKGAAFEQPRLKLSSDTAIVNADETIDINVATKYYDVVMLKLAPDGLAKLSETGTIADKTVKLLGLKDGKVTVTATGMTMGQEVQKETLDVNVIGHIVRWKQPSGFKNMTLDLLTEKDDAEANVPLPITILTKGMDVVKLSVTPAGIADLSQAQINATGQVNLIGKKDGMATFTAVGLEEGAEIVKKSIPINVIGPQVALAKGSGYEQNPEYLERKKQLEQMAAQDQGKPPEEGPPPAGKNPGQVG